MNTWEHAILTTISEIQYCGSTEVDHCRYPDNMSVNSMYVTTPQAARQSLHKAKSQSYLQARSSIARPVSGATDSVDTEFEDDSDTGDDASARSYLESVSQLALSW